MSNNKPVYQKPLDQVFPIAADQRRVALSVSYDGRDFCGWQIQRGRKDRTVQGILEAAISVIADESIGTHCSGRTDSGVHGTNQIVHFDTSAIRPDRAWVHGVNARLPNDVSVRWATGVDEYFHARFAARSRTYRYLVNTSSQRPVHDTGMATWHARALDIEAMNQACQYLLGEQDFSAFRGAGCQSVTPMRNVLRAHWTREGPWLVFEVSANAFLLHMVRNFVGTLMHIGEGHCAPEWVSELIKGRDRRNSGVTAKPDGLYLVDVEYPRYIVLPKMPLGPFHLD